LLSDSAITIRPATSAEIPAIINLQRQTPTSAHWTQDQYEGFFSSKAPRRLVLVAESPRTEFVGFLVARHIPPDWELENIVVAANSHRSGVGQRLLTVLLETAKQCNSEAVFLEVRESNVAARSLYEKVGFRQTGSRKSYYQQPLEDAILYRRNLH